jgi:hypothetical protein
MTTAPQEIDILEDLCPAIDDRMLLRYLGYPSGELPDPRVSDVLARQREIMPTLLQPRAVTGIFSGNVCFASDFPLYDREIFLSIVTIGDQVEKRAAHYAAAGDVLNGFVLDTLGSVCAENAAAAAYQHCRRAAVAEGVQVGCRISPGYGTWALESQQAVFAVLPAALIGVRLSPGLMMVPRKSVSFAAERAAEPLRLREGEQCEHCEMDNCRYRRDTKPA